MFFTRLGLIWNCCRLLQLTSLTPEWLWRRRRKTRRGSGDTGQNRGINFTPRPHISWATRKFLTLLLLFLWPLLSSFYCAAEFNPIQRTPHLLIVTKHSNYLILFISVLNKKNLNGIWRPTLSKYFYFAH